MKLFYIFTILFLSIRCHCSLNSELPTPYNSIKILPPYYHGWFVNQKQFDNIFSNNDISVVVELGSWLGASSIYIARKLKEGGKLYAVDHWKGSIEHQNPNQKDVLHLLPTLYEQFLSNIIHANLTNIIIPIKNTTLEAAKNLSIKPDLVYVDASHDEESVYQDLKAWYPKLAYNGIMCGDDWPLLPVRKAVQRFASEKKINIFHRKGCIVHSLKLLKPGGILMLDNSERSYYHNVFPLMKNWKTIITTQNKPDSQNFYYKGWQTRWWYKPDF